MNIEKLLPLLLLAVTITLRAADAPDAEDGKPVVSKSPTSPSMLTAHR